MRKTVNYIGKTIHLIHSSFSSNSRCMLASLCQQKWVKIMVFGLCALHTATAELWSHFYTLYNMKFTWNIFFSYVTRIRDRSGKEAIIYKLLWASITTWWHCIEESLQFLVVQPVNTAISNRKINESLNYPNYSL